MYYSDEIVEEVRMKNDIVDVISDYVKLQKKGSSYFGLCPFHNEKSPSFSVSPGKQMYYCFGCGAGGNVFTFIMEYENYTFVEALKYLAQRAGVTLPEAEYSKEAKAAADLRTTLLEIQKKAAAFYYYQLRQDTGKQGMAYLKGRELSDETIHKFGLGCSPRYSGALYQYLKNKGYSDAHLKESGLFNVDERRGMQDKFWNRVMFPIMDVNNRVIGFGGRVMGDAKPKYLNSPETKIFDKSRNLYGLNIARTSRKPYLIVCEGYMDVISMHQAGFTNAVASLGTALTSGHASLLKRYTQEVRLLYDSDEAGIRAALRGIPILREAGVATRVVNLAPYKDPDEFIKALGAEAFQERLDRAVNGFLFRVQAAQKNYNLSDPQGKTEFFHQVAEMLLEFPEELERSNYIEAIAQEYRISPEELKRAVSRQAMKGTVAERRMVPKETRKSKGQKENGAQKAQKLMLTWLANEPETYSTVKKYLGPEDFTTELYRRVAGMLFEQLEDGQVSLARLLNPFTDSEEQTEITSLFHADIHLESQEEKNRAFADALIRIKENSLREQTEKLAPTDIEGLQRLIQEKKKLEEMSRRRGELHISF